MKGFRRIDNPPEDPGAEFAFEPIPVSIEGRIAQHVNLAEPEQDVIEVPVADLRAVLAVLNAIGPVREAVKRRVSAGHVGSDACVARMIRSWHTSECTCGHDELRAALALLDNLGGEHG